MSTKRVGNGRVVQLTVYKRELSHSNLAIILNITRGQLSKLVAKYDIPRDGKPRSSNIRYNYDEVMDWLEGIEDVKVPPKFNWRNIKVEPTPEVEPNFRIIPEEIETNEPVAKFEDSNIRDKAFDLLYNEIKIQIYNWYTARNTAKIYHLYNLINHEDF